MVRLITAIRSVNEGISFAAPAMVASATFIVRVMSGGTLTPENVFTAVALFTLLQVRLCVLHGHLCVRGCV